MTPKNLFAFVSVLTLLPVSQLVARDVSVVGLAGPGGNRALRIGFTVQETSQFVVFALGPSQKDLPQPVAADPRIAVRSGGQVIDTVDNWADHPSSETAIQFFDEAGVWLEAKEAAMVVRLAPGGYELSVENAGSVWGHTRIGVTRWEGGAGSPVGGNSPKGDAASGAWKGQAPKYSVCLNVSNDGTKLTSNGSSCPMGNSLRIKVTGGGLPECGASGAYLHISDDVPIVDGRFEASGTFNAPWATTIVNVTGTISGNSASGTLKRNLAFLSPSNTCTGDWMASPMN